MATGDAGFVGSMPQFYEQHMRALLFQPYAEEMAGRLEGLTQGRLLETAAGTGIVTAALAASLPAGVQIVATDLNQPMLDLAMSKPGLERVRFQQADAQALPFADSSFDVVVCQFGVMFFPDRVAAYREAWRVLRPGGRLLFNVWDVISQIPVMEEVVAGLRARYPAHASWFLERTPCGYHDVGVIRADLLAAGFAECRFETVARLGHAADARGAVLGACFGSPMRAEIEALDPTGLEAAMDAATAAVAARFGTGAFETKLQAIVIEAARG